MKFTHRLGMLTLASAAAFVALANPSFAQDQETVTFCAGSSGRNYDSVMQSIGAELENRGYKVQVLNLKGSEDILNNLDRGTCSFGPAQKDVYYSMTRKNNRLSSTAVPVVPLYNEVMTMFCSKSSGFDELSDLNEDTKIIVDGIGSGSALTWETMVNIKKEAGYNEGWMNAQIQYTPLDEAAAALALGNADCVFGVGAVPSNWALGLQEQGETLSWIYDKSLNKVQVGKSSLYEYKRVPYGSYNSKFDTNLVPAVLFRSSKVHVPQEVDSLVKRIAPSIGAKFNTVK